MGQARRGLGLGALQAAGHAFAVLFGQAQAPVDFAGEPVDLGLERFGRGGQSGHEGGGGGGGGGRGRGGGRAVWERGRERGSRGDERRTGGGRGGERGGERGGRRGGGGRGRELGQETVVAAKALPEALELVPPAEPLGQRTHTIVALAQPDNVVAAAANLAHPLHVDEHAWGELINAHRQGGEGEDRQAAAQDDGQVGLLHQGSAAVELAGQGLAKEGDVGLDQAATVLAEGGLGAAHVSLELGAVVVGAAVDAVLAHEVAVRKHDLVARQPGRQLEGVDVLGKDAQEQAAVGKHAHEEVGQRGLESAGPQLLGQRVEGPRVLAKVRDVEHRLGPRQL